MTTLSEKRLAQFQNKIHLQVGQALDDNTDEVETKLDSIIANTANNSVFGSVVKANTAGEVSSTPSVDFGANSSLMNVQFVGTTSHSHYDMEILVSNDDLNYFVLNSAVLYKTKNYQYTRIKFSNHRFNLLSKRIKLIFIKIISL